MCRLFGLIANKEVDIQFSMLEATNNFKSQSPYNPDGWGVGWYRNGLPKIFKEGISADDNNSKFTKLSKMIRSKIVISHVRKGTVGCASRENSHPFQYRNWIFAHNGSINKYHILPFLENEYKQRIKGETDSEVYFYWVLQCIEEAQNHVEGIIKAVNKVIEGKYSGLNFLLSDGDSLYSLRYSNNGRDYYSLYYLKREPSTSGPIEIESEETRLLMQSKSLNGERAVIIASEPLTEEKWEEVKFGSLVIVDNSLNIKKIQILQ